MKSQEMIICGLITFAVLFLIRASPLNHTTTSPAPAPPTVPTIEMVKVLETLPHDRSVFVQGLEFHEGFLYQTGGLYGRSLLRKLNVTTGQEVKRISLPAAYFAEGLTIFDDKLYVLTWREYVVFQYDLDFQLLRQFDISTEGWGLTHDDKSLIYSDGSDSLFYVSPATFQVEKTLKVKERTQSGTDKSVSKLNELEFLNGFIYSNVWMASDFLIVDPRSGYVVKRVRCSPLSSRATKTGGDVLNGIAFDPLTDALYITGKLWPTIHRIEDPMR